jgi:polyisoprenyl-teichoic acid--peptidoglycan teichoic acid transferase
MSEPPPRVGRPLLARAAIAGLIVVFCVAAATATGTLLQVKDVTDTLGKYGHVAKFRKNTITRADAGKPQTILLVGSDHRYGHSKTDARSDTLMLLRLDPDQRAISALSVPRDLAVPIPGHGLSKINAAYGEGGLDLTTRTVEKLLSFPGHPFRINHAITATFDGFTEVVNRLHCVYVDVDRRYYHSNAGLPPSQQYSEINIQPGYQRLCGTKGLAYARYRHGDNDLVRAARQQQFVSDLKQQAGGGNLFGKLKSLVKIFAKTTETDADLQKPTGLLRLIDLLVFSQHHALVSIHFPASFVNVNPRTGSAANGVTAGADSALGDYVTASSGQVRAVVHRFMHADSFGPKKAAPPKGGGAKKHRGKIKKAAPTAASFGLVDSLSTGATLAKAALAAHHLAFPMYVPAWLTARGTYPTNEPAAPSPNVYVLKDRSGRAHKAYRFVLTENETEGQYYGVEGTGWQHPPLLDGKTTTYRAGGRNFTLIGDGSHLRFVVWRTRKGVYWVSNTLSLDLSTNQMIGLARSLTKVKR